MAKGTKSTGKVAYLNAIFPYMVMMTLMTKVFTLPGAWDGVSFLFVPKWEELSNLRVWYKALMQSFYSLTIGVGSIQNYTSSNHFRHNLYRYEITYYVNLKKNYFYRFDCIKLNEILDFFLNFQRWIDHSHYRYFNSCVSSNIGVFNPWLSGI